MVRRKQEVDVSRLMVIEMGNLPIILFKGKIGYLATVHIDKETAEKIGDVAGFVPAVKSVDEFLNAKLKDVTSWAEDVGLRPGMTVRKAIRLLDEE